MFALAAQIAIPADRQTGIERAHAESAEFAELRTGHRVAVFLPANNVVTQMLCKAVGNTGHVYAVVAPSAARGAREPLIDYFASDSCTNVTALTLHSRNYPAPELYNSSDDPGAVYEYWEQRLPIESFVAPQPLDMIWIADSYQDLRSARFGSPNMMWVNSAFLKALKSGGVLIVEDYLIEDNAAASGSSVKKLRHNNSDQVKTEVIAAGFEFIAESKAIHSDDDPHAPKTYKTHRTDRFLLKFRKPPED